MKEITNLSNENRIIVKFHISVCKLKNFNNLSESFN